MKKLRVFQAFKTTGSVPHRQPLGSKRRIVPGLFSKNLGTILLFLLMLPYIITFLFGNVKEGSQRMVSLDKDGSPYEGTYSVSNVTAFGNESIPLEIYVADRLARSMGDEFELEALKAQAVLIRSGLIASFYSDGESSGGGRKIEVTDESYGSVPVFESAMEAISQTKGVCLMYQNRPVNGAYFALSNGATRNAEELSLMEYPYLKSVLCSRDFLSADYASSVSLRESEFDRLWQQMPAAGEMEHPKKENESEMELGDISIWRDSVGYVLYLKRDGKLVTGEQFRESFHLASASFHLNKEDEKVIIAVKGVGHGLGMSQFGANEMAKEGEDYIGILEYFFEDVTFTKFE